MRTSLDRKIKNDAIANASNEEMHPTAIHPRATTNVTDTTTKHAANAVVTVFDDSHNQHPGDATAKPKPKAPP